MALVATYGNVNAFNIKIYDMAGGGYYATLNDASTQIFKRRNASDTHDTLLWFGAASQWVLDRFLSYSYDSTTSTLTLSGAVNTFNGIVFTRQESYRFVSAYVVEDTWTVSSDIDGGKVSGTNWNYYSSINAVIDIDNINFGDGTSTNPLGFGVQLTASGSFYGFIADNGYNNQNNNRKRALASQLGVACTWITPGDASKIDLTQSLNNRTLSITQWFFKSTNTLPDFILKSQLAVASAKAYTGTQWDKICQVDAYLCIYLATNLTDILIVPSLHYSSGMWMRDSFWVSFLIDDIYEQAAITRFENKQQVSGQIPTQIDKGGSSLQLFQDECTCLYIIRAYYDSVIRGLTINQTVLQNALTYIRSQVVNSQYQFTSADSHHFKSWLDTYTTTTNTYCAYNQGLYALALKCAKKMGLIVTDLEIQNAITQYTNLYDSTLGYIKFVSDKNYFSTDTLTPEALSIFILKEKMLTSDIVSNTISFMRDTVATTAGMKCIADSDGNYLSPTLFLNSYSAGDYHNGGSWFLYEYLAYYVGFYHTNLDIQSFINQRITQEMQSEATSHEYLVSSSSLTHYLSETADRHAYGWNTASYIIKIPMWTQKNSSSSNFINTALVDTNWTRKK